MTEPLYVRVLKAASQFGHAHEFDKPQPIPSLEVFRLLTEVAAALRAMPLQQRVAGQWTAGAPPMPWSEEWFIAETTFGDRVVLKALPKEWTYDFKTADDTYIKADKIKRWMQFPDSQFVDFVEDRRMVAEQQTEAKS